MNRYDFKVLLVIFFFTIFRLIVGTGIGLGVDESYIVAVARHFSLSYIDHPPLHIWLAGAMPHIFGSQNAVVVRLPFIILFMGTTWLMYKLTARLFGKAAGFYAALLLNISAVFSLSSGGWVLPDGPLMFFMLAGGYILVKVIFDSASYTILNWLLFGFLSGLAMLSKYHGIFLFVGLFLFLLTAKKYRHLLYGAGPYLSVLIAAVVFLPVVIWNIQHDWISFVFQGSRGVAKGFYPLKLVANILAQAVWVLPWIWILLVVEWIKNLIPWRSTVVRIEYEKWLLVCIASGPLLIFTLVNLWGTEGLPHWQAPGYLFLFPLLGQTMALNIDRSLSRKVWLGISCAAYIAIVIVLASHTATGWLKNVIPNAFVKGDASVQALNWDDAVKDINLINADYKPKNMFIITRSWIDAGKIDYAANGLYQVLCLSKQPHQYPFIYNQNNFVGRDALIIGRKSVMADIQEELGPYFLSLRRVKNISIYRNGVVEEELHCYLAENFRGNYPLPYGN